jgi:hypothetical protein
MCDWRRELVHFGILSFCKMERIARWCPSKGEATNQEPKMHVDRDLGNQQIPRRQFDDWAAQLQHSVLPQSYFGTAAARSISRRSQTTFSSAKFAPWQLSHPLTDGLWELFRWKSDYSSTPSALQSWLGTFWLLAFLAHKDGTGRIMVPRARGSSHCHSGISEWNSEVRIGTRLSPLDRTGSMGVG